MSDDAKVHLFFIACLLAFMGVFAIGVLWVSSVACHARWEGTGQATKWSVFARCRVETVAGSGKFVPERTLRNIDEVSR